MRKIQYYTDWLLCCLHLFSLFLYSALLLGFPNEPAAVIALSTIKEWLAKNHHEVGRTTQSLNIQGGVISKKHINVFYKYQVGLVIEPKVDDRASFRYHE